MQILWQIAQTLIEGTNTITTFLTTRINIGLNSFGITIVDITPLELLSVSGLMTLAIYYLIRGLII